MFRCWLLLFVAVASALDTTPLLEFGPRHYFLSRDPTPLRFLTLGDWGMGNPDPKATAALIREIVSAHDVDLIVNVGDNFYKTNLTKFFHLREGGVENLQDPLWKSYFEDMYAGSPRQIPWLSALGNHDYMGNVSAQRAYGEEHPEWVMPENYYAITTPNGHGGNATFVVLDTTPLIEEYDLHPENPTMFLNLLKAHHKEQLEWLELTLAKAGSDEQVFVVGHHPVVTGATGIEDNGKTLFSLLPHLYSMTSVKSILERHNVHAYFAGHVHNLEFASSNGIDYFISGAAATGNLTYVREESNSKGWVSKEAGVLMSTIGPNSLFSEFVGVGQKLLYNVTTSLKK